MVLALPAVAIAMAWTLGEPTKAAGVCSAWGQAMAQHHGRTFPLERAIGIATDRPGLQARRAQHVKPGRPSGPNRQNFPWQKYISESELQTNEFA